MKGEDIDLLYPDLPSFRWNREESAALGRPKIHCIYGQWRWRAVGNRIYRRHPNETFYKFLVELLKFYLGKPWLDSERNRSLEKRHTVIKWIHAYYEFLNEYAKMSKDHATPQYKLMTGDIQCLMALCYDVYMLLHTRNFDKKTFKRLRHHKFFQGARYEISIASVFSRLGCSLAYPNTQLPGKHPEFVATFPDGSKIAIEAKSRHRPGVLEQPGLRDCLSELTANVGKLIKEAISQRSHDMPFAVFIDLNYPPTQELKYTDKKWFSDVVASLDAELPTPEEGKKEHFNAIFFTSFPNHYVESGLSRENEVLAVMPEHPCHPFPFDLLKWTISAIQAHGRLPDEPF